MRRNLTALMAILALIIVIVASVGNVNALVSAKSTNVAAYSTVISAGTNLVLPARRSIMAGASYEG